MQYRLRERNFFEPHSRRCRVSQQLANLFLYSKYQSQNSLRNLIGPSSHLTNTGNRKKERFYSSIVHCYFFLGWATQQMLVQII